MLYGNIKMVVERSKDNMKNLVTISAEYLQKLQQDGITSNVFDFKAYARAIAENQARKSHEAWCEKKRADGYVYGEEVDDVKKTTNLLVPFEKLPDHYKQANIENAVATVELLMNAGCFVGELTTTEEREKLVKNMAETLHDKWVVGKMKAGYIFGEIRNDDPKKGQLTHRDMLPFDVLLEVYPEDAAYDVDTAKGILDGFIEDGYVVVKTA